MRLQSKKPCLHVHCMLQFNFILGSIFTFLCSFFMLIYDNEYETKEKKLNEG